MSGDRAHGVLEEPVGVARVRAVQVDDVRRASEPAAESVLKKVNQRLMFLALEHADVTRIDHDPLQLPVAHAAPEVTGVDVEDPDALLSEHPQQSLRQVLEVSDPRHLLELGLPLVGRVA